MWIVGTGGFSREVNDYVRKSGDLLDGHLDDHPPEPSGRFQRIFRIGDPRARGHYVIAIGSNSDRMQVADQIALLYGAELKPCVYIATNVHIGGGCIIETGSILCPGVVVSADCTIGKHCILNIMSSVTHGDVIGDFVNIAPGAMVLGNCTVGEGVYIGANATLREGVKIGAWATIGAGAVVTKDVPASEKWVGVPAGLMAQAGPGVQGTSGR